MAELIICAFCTGKKKDPFSLLSKNATCQVCGGAGSVEIEEPAIQCIYCKGTGAHPFGTRITCIVCMGKGMVTIKEDETEKCSDCNGSGRAVESNLPCLTCKGKGVVSLKKVKKSVRGTIRFVPAKTAAIC